MQVGIVVIGRNEAKGLDRCLRSALREGVPVIYADSDSSDDSVNIAERLGVLVERVPGKPPTAARGRNAGVRRLCATWPQIELVQFVDGDCELVSGWLPRAVALLQEDDRAAVICGRQREHARDTSIYSRLLDLEWDTPLGDDVAECGGAALMRLIAFSSVGGFRADMPAGEEPELCVRLRAAGWRVRRVAIEMTVHDGRMTRFGQWWRRAERAGHAYANGAALHFRSPPRLWIRQAASPWAWAIGLPLAALLLGTVDPLFAAVVGLAYPLQLLRIHTATRRRGVPRRDAALYAAACLISKLPELIGQMRYLLSRRTAVLPPAASLPLSTPCETLPHGLAIGPVRVQAVTEAQCVEHVMTALAAGRGGWIVTVNLHHVRLFADDPAYAELCAQASLRVADGMPLVWASRLRGTPLPERVAGSNLIRSLSTAAAARGFPVYLLGGDPGAAGQAAQRLQAENPRLRIAGVACPAVGWRDHVESEGAVLDAVIRAEPALVFVALAKPAQDQVIARLLQRLPATWFVGVGISFSFVAGQLHRAPPWMQNFGLEWLHRLWQEPRRLWARYLGMLPHLWRLLRRALAERSSTIAARRSADGSGPDR